MGVTKWATQACTIPVAAAAAEWWVQSYSRRASLALIPLSAHLMHCKESEVCHQPCIICIDDAHCLVHSSVLVLDGCSFGWCLCDMIFWSLHHLLPNSIHAHIMFFLQRLKLMFMHCHVVGNLRLTVAGHSMHESMWFEIRILAKPVFSCRGDKLIQGIQFCVRSHLPCWKTCPAPTFGMALLVKGYNMSRWSHESLPTCNQWIYCDSLAWAVTFACFGLHSTPQGISSLWLDARYTQPNERGCVKSCCTSGRQCKRICQKYQSYGFVK